MDKLLGQVTDLRDRAVAIRGKAEGSEDFRTALGAIREARGCLELLGKLAGQLQDAATINVIVTPEWQQLQAAVLAALFCQMTKSSLVSKFGDSSSFPSLPM